MEYTESKSLITEHELKQMTGVINVATKTTFLCQHSEDHLSTVQMTTVPN